MAREWLNLANEQKDGRVKGNVNHIGPWTHRCSHHQPNMGNVAKVQTGDSGPLMGLEGNFGWESRACWIAEQGRVLVGADASGIQLRALAHYMDDPDYIKEVCEGDVHIANMKAAELQQRDTAKTFIYAWLLGAGDEKIGMIVDVKLEEYKDIFQEAKQFGRYNHFRNENTNMVWYVYDRLIHQNREADEKTTAIILKGYLTKKKFLDNLPALRRFREEDIKTTAQQGYMIGLDGRKIWVPSEHLAMGAYLQGFEAVVMKWAMKIYQEKLRSQGVPFWQVDFVHDEYQVETLPEYGNIVGQTIVDSIKEAGEILGSRCPLDGEYKIGKSWAETH